MRKPLIALLGVALIGIVPAQARENNPEAELARALEGRVAGEPVDCVNLRQVRSTRVIPNTAILYDAGGTIYVNRPESGADELNRWDTMVTRLHSSQLCNIDTVRMVDTSTHTMTGIVFLGDFVPYRRVR